MHFRRFAMRVTLGTLAASASGTVLAQSNQSMGKEESAESAVKDIIVTAERRTVGIQHVPVSVSVRSGEDLRGQGRSTLSQMLDNVPGVSGTASTGTSGGGSDSPETGIAIRGVPANASAAGSIISSVPTTAVYVDEVYGGIGGNYDIERLEVLRGPQGTLYGRSATAGLVAIHSIDPKLKEFSGSGLAEIGNYDLRHFSGALNVPIGDDVAIRASGNHYQRDGYDAPAGGALRTNEGRLKLLLKPTSNLSAMIAAAFQDNVTHTGEQALQLTAPDTFVKVPIGTAEGRNRFRQFSAVINYDLGFATLTYVPAYRTWHQDANILVLGPAGLVLSQKQYVPKDNFLTQEFRIASPTGSKLIWQAGVYYYDNDLESRNSSELKSNGALAYSSITRKTTRDLGVYAEVSYPITNGLRVSGGLRYDNTYVRSDQDYTANLNFGVSGIPGTPDFSKPEILVTKSVSGEDATSRFNNVTYKARLEYDLSPENLLYGSISTGFLPGDVQVVSGANNQPLALSYKEETLTSYEIGTKNRFFNNLLQMNGAVFHYVYGGYQTAVNIGNAFAPSFVQVTAPARMTGFEIEILVRPTRHDRLGINAGYVDARFVNQTSAIRAVLSKDKIPYIPSTTASAFWEHDIALPGGSFVTVRGEGVYRSASDLSPLSAADAAAGGAALIRAKGQLVGNANINWNLPGKRFSIGGFVRNVTNQRTAATLSVLSIAPLAITGTRTDPRTFGVILQTRF